jgi:hypothetical protein
MERTKKTMQYLFLFLLLAVLMPACSGSNQIGEIPSDAVCSSIVDTKCTKCHYKTRICDALGTKSVSRWRKTIKFMMRQGAGLSEDEQQKVVACLSSLPSGSEIVCQ